MAEVIAGLALFVSVISFYFQWLRLRGAQLLHLNAGTGQRATLMSYQQLPQNIRDDFPRYSHKHDTYLFVRVAFANTGDRTGFCDIKDVAVSIAGTDNLTGEDRIQAAYYSYAVVGPQEVKTHSILLRNIPPTAHSKTLHLELKVDYAWVDPRRGLVDRKLNLASAMDVHIEDPSLGQRDDAPRQLPLTSHSALSPPLAGEDEQPSYAQSEPGEKRR